MKQRRKRTYIKPKPVIILLLGMVVAAGVWFSPITAVRHVRVEGALPTDQQRLTEIVSSLKGVPCIQIDPRDVESRALAASDIKTAELTRNPFGSALLKVTYRSPIARIFGSPNILLSEEGVLYPSAQSTEGLPIVHLQGGGPPTLVTLAANWQPNLVAKLSKEARQIFADQELRIQEEPGGVVWLNVDSGRVKLGSLDDLDKKLSTLRLRLQKDPNELSTVEYLNLTEPDSPSIKPRSR